MIRQALVGALSAALVAVAVVAPKDAVTGCTKQQAITGANLGIQFAVDACKEAPELLPDSGALPGIVALLCPALGGAEQLVEVLVDRAIWDAAKARYLREHGALPKGMTPPKG